MRYFFASFCRILAKDVVTARYEVHKDKYTVRYNFSFLRLLRRDGELVIKLIKRNQTNKITPLKFDIGYIFLQMFYEYALKTTGFIVYQVNTLVLRLCVRDGDFG